MEVCSVIGQRVRILVDSNLNPGRYKAEFNAQSLSSGVYFIRMISQGEVFTKKMLLIK